MIDHRNRGDLIRGVLRALDYAVAAVQLSIRDDLAGSLESPESPAPDREASSTRSGVRPLNMRKVFAEAAMLVRCVHRIRAVDSRIGESIDRLAGLLLLHARPDDLLAALCREPEFALDHAMTYIQLRDLGFPDAHADLLLAECLRAGVAAGPERLPFRELEQQWLRFIFSGADPDVPADPALLARTCLGGPLDVLGSTTQDVYAFTHVLLYASDLGRRTVYPPRSVTDIVVDAEAALAVALDSDNFDLAAELLWTWPMLGVPLSPTAEFGFDVLTAAQETTGFLPGPEFSATVASALDAGRRFEHEVQTSYHPMLVMGLLGSMMLGSTVAPSTAVATADLSIEAVDELGTLLAGTDREQFWQRRFRQLEDTLQRQLAGLLLTVALSRARESNDLTVVRAGLRIALEHGLLDAPAPRQAVALLRRATLLGRLRQASADRLEDLPTAETGLQRLGNAH